MRYTPDSTLDLILDEYMNANEEAVCSQQPTTFFHACWPDMWGANTAYSIGDVSRSPTDNGFVYECTVAGTSGASEPPWGTTQDATFTDGTVTWKTQENYSLINSALAPADMTKDDGAIDGRTLTIAQKMGILVHTSGTVTHTALIDTVNKSLKYVTVASTTLAENNDVVSGRTTLLHSMTVTVRDPTA